MTFAIVYALAIFVAGWVLYALDKTTGEESK